MLLRRLLTLTPHSIIYIILFIKSLIGLPFPVTPRSLYNPRQNFYNAYTE